MGSEGEGEGVRARLYFASPLFSAAEQRFNEATTNLLQPYFDVYLPQRDGGLMLEMIKRGISPSDAASLVFCADVDAIARCDVLVAVLDGRTVDEGVAFELGLAYAQNKTCIGLQTDVRRLLPTGNNPMIERALRHTFATVDELVSWSQGYRRPYRASALVVRPVSRRMGARPM
jgi:nucleoside 2-deoxyribosyltransferase